MTQLMPNSLIIERKNMEEELGLTGEYIDDLKKNRAYVEGIRNNEIENNKDRFSWKRLEYRAFAVDGVIHEYIVLYGSSGKIVSAKNCSMNSRHAILRDIGEIIDGGYYDEINQFNDLYSRKTWELE